MSVENLPKTLYNAALHDSIAMGNLIVTFEPLFKKYEHMLNYYGAYSDLIIDFIEKVYSFDINRLSDLSNGQLVNYVNKIVRHKAIDLSRNKKLQPECVPLIDTLPDDSTEIESMVSFESLIRNLSEKQQLVVKLKFIYLLSDADIGKIMKISRQAVNRIYSRSLITLRKELILWKKT